MIIYKITNLKNRKVYIGQSATTGDTRWKSHRNKLRMSKHPNKHLQSSWDKYGEESFSYSKITSTCIGLLDALEVYFINKYNSHARDFGYNKDYGGHLTRKRKPATEETRRKISIANTGKKRPHREETKNKISTTLKGRPSGRKGVPSGRKGIYTNKPISDETRKKMSLAQIGKKRAKMSKESRENVSRAAKVAWIKRKENMVNKNV